MDLKAIFRFIILEKFIFLCLANVVLEPMWFLACILL